MEWCRVHLPLLFPIVPLWWLCHKEEKMPATGSPVRCRTPEPSSCLLQALVTVPSCSCWLLLFRKRCIKESSFILFFCFSFSETEFICCEFRQFVGLSFVKVEGLYPQNFQESKYFWGGRPSTEQGDKIFWTLLISLVPEGHPYAKTAHYQCSRLKLSHDVNSVWYK